MGRAPRADEAGGIYHALNRGNAKQEKEAFARSVTRGVSFGTEQWTASTVERLCLESTVRPHGRPKKLV